MDYSEPLKIFLAFLPLLWLLFSLGKLKMPAYRAGLITLFLTLIIAPTVFRMQPLPLFQASLEGIMLALFPILWVIVTALFLYNVTVANGSMAQIKEMLAGLSPDRRVQSLLLAFSFGGFLEAVAGFGTAVAIPVGILSAIGFNPLSAATICLIANTIPVAFGVLGIPIITLAQVTGLSLNTLSVYTAVQLIPFIILLPFVLIFTVTGSVKNIKGVAALSLSAGTVFAAGQTLTAMYIGAELAAVVGGLASLVLIVVWVKFFPIQNIWLFNGESVMPGDQGPRITPLKAILAWSPYLLVLFLILATRFLPFLDFLNQYPFLLKKQFYAGPGGKPLVFQLATGSGSVLLVAAVLGGLLQKSSLKMLVIVFARTVKQLGKTIITVLSIVILAKVMGYSGMINTVAFTLAAVSGSFYPVLAPLIGALGTFLTGSDTSSNVLFGNLQKQTAIQLNLNQEWITAANASGATAGKMISPQSISIATAATGLSGNEGKILNSTIKYCLVYVLIMGILIFYGS